jgi:hypothetical protein
VILLKPGFTTQRHVEGREPELQQGKENIMTLLLKSDGSFEAVTLHGNTGMNQECRTTLKFEQRKSHAVKGFEEFYY